jgi:hypothetical protein
VSYPPASTVLHASVGAFLPELYFWSRSRLLVGAALQLPRGATAPLQGVTTSHAPLGRREAERVFARNFHYVSLAAKPGHDSELFSGICLPAMHR